MKIKLSKDSTDTSSSNGIYRYEKELESNDVKLSDKSVDINSSTGKYLYEKIGE